MLSPQAPLSPEAELRGERVYLRPPRPEEMVLVRKWWNEPATMALAGGPLRLTEAEARDWYDFMIAPGRPTECFCVVFNAADQPVGEISFHRFNAETLTAELDLKIVAAQRGQGYAREALRVFLDYFFNRLGGQALLGRVAPENLAGQRVLLRFGFEPEPKTPDAFRLLRERFIAR